jgi:uncharacterized protein (UPF0371 family)
MKKTGFDNNKYLEEQSINIIKRAAQFDNKLYLEFGGKLMFDLHASRVLPGFDPNVKIKLLQRLKDKSEIIICIHAGDIERGKIRADFGLSYDEQILRDIDDLRQHELTMRAVVITRFTNQPSVEAFKNRLERREIKVYIHKPIPGYPNDIDLIASDMGYGANAFIETEKPIVVVTAPGPGSGKLATCLSQLYHENKNGINAGYAKFETFPIWNLPLNHPVNFAYEAATADLADVNLIDHFHLEAHGVKSVNYNRDLEIFPVVKRLLTKLMGEKNVYQSPTDMGVNMAGYAITDDNIVREAAIQEIIRRFFKYSCEYMLGRSDMPTIKRVENIMHSNLDVHSTDRTVVIPARKAAEKGKQEGKGHNGIFVGAAIELNDGTIIIGTNSPVMHASSAVFINAIKFLAKIPNNIHLISPNLIESISKLKTDTLGGNEPQASLNLSETLIALAVSAATNPTADVALSNIKDLKGCEMHITHIPTPGDEDGLRRLKVNLTSDPHFSSKSLFVS